MNRAERRAAANARIIKASAEAQRKAAFAAKMQAYKEARVAERLYSERKVKLVALPTGHAITLAQRAVQQRRAKSERRA